MARFSVVHTIRTGLCRPLKSRADGHIVKILEGPGRAAVVLRYGAFWDVYWL